MCKNAKATLCMVVIILLVMTFQLKLPIQADAGSVGSEASIATTDEPSGVVETKEDAGSKSMKEIVIHGEPLEAVKTDIVKFEIFKADGTQPEKFSIYNHLRIFISWDASYYEDKLREGDYFDIKLPDSLYFPNDEAVTVFDILSPDGNDIVAKGKVSPAEGGKGGGTVRVTFTKFVHNRHNIKGNVWLACVFAKDKIKFDDHNTFEIAIGSVTESKTIYIIGPQPIENEIGGKYPQKVTGHPDQVMWTVRVNHMKRDPFTNVVISDQLEAVTGDLEGIKYLTDTFLFRKVTIDEYGQIKEYIETIDITVNFDATETSFSINLGNLSGAQYLLTYKSTYKPGMKLKNNANLVSNEAERFMSATFENASSGGEGDGDLLGKIKIIKVDAADNTELLSGAKFRIKRDGTNDTWDFVTNNKGEIITQVLMPGKYFVQEIEAPVGFELDAKTIEVTVESDKAVIRTIENKKIKTSIPVKKVWFDADNQDGVRPANVTFRLFANDKEVDSKLIGEAEGWAWEFADLPKYEAGKEIVYTVKEDAVEGYTTTISGDAADGFVVTNTHEPKVIPLTPPTTGESKNLLLYSTMLLLAGVIILLTRMQITRYGLKK